MKHVFRPLFCLLLAVLLASCAATDKRAGDSYSSTLAEQIGINHDEDGHYKYDAWRLKISNEYEAINVLLDEADVLIENRAFNAAADKLERVLRIKPEYAPAWSRLSWIALQMNVPKRSVQMAKRSNSFAYANPELQVLNWRFIRSASEALNDEDSYYRAKQKIESLTIF